MPEGSPGRPDRPILIVDDDPDVAGVLAAILAEEGRDAAIARDGREALALARAAPPALILLDVLLPDLDGAEVCRQFRPPPASRSSSSPARRPPWRVAAWTAVPTGASCASR
jgi:CheY-like chemotaxis protein